MPAAIDEVIIERAREEWASDPETSAKEVARRFQRKFGPRLVSSRTIEAAVAEVKAQAPKEPFPLIPWKPWASPEESLEDTRYLLRLRYMRREEQGPVLYTHEAKWALRLRMDLEGLEPLHRQLELIQSYGEREKTGYYLGAPPYTEDLDAFAVHQMWRSPDHQRRYEKALADGIAPVPFLGATQAFVKELRDQGPGKVGTDVWDHLGWHAIYREFLKEDGMKPGWSAILLEYLDDPQTLDALLAPPPPTRALRRPSSLIRVKEPVL